MVPEPFPFVVPDDANKRIKEIEDLNDALDALVYKLYGLTEEEKKIIEEN